MGGILVRLHALDDYAPGNHTGTSNRRLIGAATVGARTVEVLVGTIAPGHGARRHRHPRLEQAFCLLSGSGSVEVDGVTTEVVPGRWHLVPRDAAHRFDAHAGPETRVLVVYGPPLEADPAGSVSMEEGRHAARAFSAAPSVSTPAARSTQSADASCGDGALPRCETMLGRSVDGCLAFEIYELRVPAQGVVRSTDPVLAPTALDRSSECALVVLHGQVTCIDGPDREAAQPGDALYFGQPAALACRASDSPLRAALIVSRLAPGGVALA